MKKYYVYSVSYFHENGSGNMCIYRKNKIKTLQDFNSVIDSIKTEFGYEKIVIINIIPLGKERK